MADYPAGIAQRRRVPGLGHWRWKRYSAVVVLLLMVYFVITLASLGNLDHAGAMTLVGHPANALALAGLVTIGMWHGMLGLQVVIEDYISVDGGRHAALLVVRVVMGLIGAASLWAIVRVAL